MDGSHGLNAQGYQVYTVGSLTGNRTGIPLITFLVPNQHDEFHLRAALECAQALVAKTQGFSMKTGLWMIDDSIIGQYMSCNNT